MIRTPVLFGCSATVPLTNLPANEEFYMREMRIKLADQLAAKIVGELVKVTDESHTRTYDLRVLVITPNYLEQLISAEIIRRNSGYPRGFVL
jgi:hypothetical protein